MDHIYIADRIRIRPILVCLSFNIAFYEFWFHTLYKHGFN